MRAALLLAALALLLVPAAPAVPSGQTCVTLVGDAALLPPAEDLHPCSGLIRPGASLGGCTLAFIARDEAGALYATTAGHCTGSIGQRISAAGVGPFGSVVFRVNAGVGRDIALIAIDAEKYGLVEPSMCHWGGPVAGDDGVTGPVPALHYGWGFFWNQQPATRARAHLISGAYADHVTFAGEVTPGDSGSPIQTATGEAMGIVTHTILLPGPAPLGGGLAFATRIGHGFALASAATGHTYEVVAGVPVDPTGLGVP